MSMKNIVKLNPTVCVVGKTYQIIIVTEQDALISVRVGDKTYYNPAMAYGYPAPVFTELQFLQMCWMVNAVIHL